MRLWPWRWVPGVPGDEPGDRVRVGARWVLWVAILFAITLAIGWLLQGGELERVGPQEAERSQEVVGG